MLEKRLLDVRFKLRGPKAIESTPFQIVAVDDQSFRQLQEKWPFGGSLYARLIRNLNRAGARLIVFDIEFTEANARYPQQDSIFARAIGDAGNVILAGKMAYQFDNYLQQPYALPVPPLAAFLEAGADWGIVNELPDADDFIRRYLLYLYQGEELCGSLGLQTLAAMYHVPDCTKIQVQERICRYGSLEIPLNDPQSFFINYYGPAGTFPAISFTSVLDDASFDLGPEYDSDYMEMFTSGANGVTEAAVQNPFRDKVVLVGVSAAELGDGKNTPFYDYELTPRKTPGVEIHAHAMQTILDGSYIRRIPSFYVLLVCIFLGYLSVYLLGRSRLLRGSVQAAFLALAVFVGAFILFERWHLWLDVAPSFFTLALAFTGAALSRYGMVKAEKARLRLLFSRFVPEEVIEELVCKPQLLRLGGERRRLTILFADLEGFTSIAEKCQPEELVGMLNEYMSKMTRLILDHGGIIDKYEGDLIMAEFGIPVPSEDHSTQACRAALKMQQALRNLHARWRSQGRPTPRFRIGIHTGDVIVGNMGSKEVFDYTVLGDAVNLCSRLEEANKFYGTTILISQATKEALPPEVVTRELGELQVRGRSSAVMVHELLAVSETLLDDDFKERIALFRHGVSHVREEEWEEAAIYFERALEIGPDDQPSRILLERCRQNSTAPAPKIAVLSE
jgi:adenylate cyclase